MAADTLAIATLVNCEDDLLCKEIMEQFQSLWSTGEMTRALYGHTHTHTHTHTHMDNTG